MAFTRKLIASTTCDFGLLLAIGLSALVVAITLLLAEWWTCSLVILWVTSVNLFNSWRAWRRLPDSSPNKAWFRLRELLVPNVVIACVLTVASRVRLPRFSLRILLLSFVLCATILSWLKVRDDQRKNELRSELRKRLAVLELEHEKYLRRVQHEESIERLTTMFQDRPQGERSGPLDDLWEQIAAHHKLQTTEFEIEQIQNQLEQLKSK